MCDHENRQLFEIKRKGRPVSQCVQVQSVRTRKPLRSKCSCKEYMEGTNVFVSSQEPTSKPVKKSREVASDASKIKNAYGKIKRDQENIDISQLNPIVSNYNISNNSDQWDQFSDDFRLQNNLNMSANDTYMVLNGSCDFNNLTIYPQNSGLDSDSPAEMSSYFNSQYPSNFSYPITIERNKETFSFVLNDMDFYQTYDKSTYADFTTMPNCSYTIQETNLDPHVFLTHMSSDYNQYFKTQNNSDVKISGSFVKPQMTILNDSPDYSYGAPETYYSFDCSRMGFKCTCGPDCKCINCYTHFNNIIHNSLQNILVDERLLFDLYTNSEKLSMESDTELRD
ncbi:hypothetical protein PCANB_000685 [Pneumocystis canis]|nr:hypothetical protein PCANB_000685 [Pneumocystis canis]